MKHIIFFLIAFAFWSCSKKKEEPQPVADFTFDKSEYIAGETIHLTNTSRDAKSYEWLFPDGTGSESRDASYVTPMQTYDSEYIFNLTVYSESGKKSNHILKYIPVKAPVGKIVCYITDPAKTGYYYVNVRDRFEERQFSKTGVPQCDEEGYLTFSGVTSGTHVVTSKSSTGKVLSNTTVTVTPFSCIKVNIQGN